MAWTLRVFEAKKVGQRKAGSYTTDARTPEEAAQAVTNVLHHSNVTRVDIVSSDHESEPVTKAATVKAQKIEWRQGEHPRGELWWGFVGERKVADVFAHSEDGVKANYTLFLGGGDDEQYVECSSIESGKRSAQRALNKVVQALVGG